MAKSPPLSHNRIDLRADRVKPSSNITLPDAYHFIAKFRRQRIRAKVVASVPRQLGAPERCVRTVEMAAPVHRASVPEAAVNEDGHAGCWEDHIRRAAADQGATNPETKASTM